MTTHGMQPMTRRKGDKMQRSKWVVLGYGGYPDAVRRMEGNGGNTRTRKYRHFGERKPASYITSGGAHKRVRPVPSHVFSAASPACQPCFAGGWNALLHPRRSATNPAPRGAPRMVTHWHSDRSCKSERRAEDAEHEGDAEADERARARTEDRHGTVAAARAGARAAAGPAAAGA